MIAICAHCHTDIHLDNDEGVSDVWCDCTTLKLDAKPAGSRLFKGSAEQAWEYLSDDDLLVNHQELADSKDSHPRVGRKREGVMVAALYVQPGGVYYGLPDVIPWGLPERDARDYAGPWPVVAHPPCQRWGRYWSGGPMLARTPKAKKLGDDSGCFAAAIAAVRKWGGVLEHPEASHAWRVHGLLAPPRRGGWVPAGDWLGWTCCVEQGHYEHRSRKATWLYAVGCELPELKWGSCSVAHRMARLDDGYHSKEERRKAQKPGTLIQLSRLSRLQRIATPIPFRDLLLSIARSAQSARGAA